MMVATRNGRGSLGGRAGKAAAALVLSLGVAFSGPRADEPLEHGEGVAPDQPAIQIAMKGSSAPSDIVLWNQDGERIHFYRDLIEGKVVAINTIFTTCLTICPIMGLYFAELQNDELLGDRIGRDVNLISISIDPGIDSPERLKAWSQELGAGPGWTLLTGSMADVLGLLNWLAIQFPGDDKTTHSQLVLVGNDATDTWTYVRGDASPDELSEAIVAALESG
jgi:protein SCO1/2